MVDLYASQAKEEDFTGGMEDWPAGFIGELVLRLTIDCRQNNITGLLKDTEEYHEVGVDEVDV
jgi:hypothetical protein